MLDSLDSAYAFVRAAPRRRSREEPHWRLNQAWFDLVFAWGYANVGQRDRSSQLVRAAREVLNSVVSLGAPGSWLLAAFEARIETAAEVSPWTPLVLGLTGLEDFERYRAEFVLARLAILSRTELWAPAERFGHREAARSDIVTRALLADGANDAPSVRSLVQEFLSQPPTTVCGASLVGPATRVGLRDELAAFIERCSPTLSREAALVALGRTSGDLRLERFRIPGSVRPIIGALALAGRTSDAQELFSAAWRELSTDSFSTRRDLTVTAVAMCETLVLSTLKHELAPGNRTALDPLLREPPLEARREPPKEGARVVRTAVEREQTFDDSPEPTLKGALGELECVLAEYASRPSLSGRFETRVSSLRVVVGRMVEAMGGNPLLSARGEEYARHSLESIQSILDATVEALEQCAEPDALPAGAAGFMDDLKRLASEGALRVRRGRVTMRRVNRSLGALSACLAACALERPGLPADVFEQIHAVLRAIPAEEPPALRAEQSWRLLLERIDLHACQLRRWLARPPDEWSPAYATSVRQGAELVDQLFGRLMTLERVDGRER